MWQNRLIKEALKAFRVSRKASQPIVATAFIFGAGMTFAGRNDFAFSSASEEVFMPSISIGEYNANDPIEDRHLIKDLSQGEFIAAVFDGHGGWQAAEFAQKRMAKVVQIELATSMAKTPNEISDALTRSFLRIEREFLFRVKFAFELGFGEVARTGACALVAMIRNENLFIANAGDCRAVLARKSSDSEKLEAIALSNDHNAREPVEQAKLRALHPNEKDIIYCKQSTSCYVRGRLQPTRSFGDAYLKYSEFNAQPGQHSSAGRHIPAPYTPPYISADPEIQHHVIDPSKDEFILLASDGLWDYMDNEEAIEVVNRSEDKEKASENLIKEVLERAARHHKIDGGVDSLKALPSGRARRVKHDDLTCVVVFLNNIKN
mmetsp:Transcript_19504/g.27388  ORF Transcript_19504/g.27388 Transcript_19504/m.27388 type:complete len:377 (+) Transcript_19504:293-1423(+)